MPLGAPRSPLVLSLDRSLRALLIAGIALAGMLTALLPWDGPAGAMLLLFPAIFLIYLGAGLMAWLRRPSNRMGALIVAAGFAVYLGGGLWNTEVDALVSVGAVCATLVLASIVHLLHAFPSGRLADRASAATVAAAYIVALPLQAPRYLFDASGPAPWLAIADSPAALETGIWVQEIAGAGVMIATAVLLGRRLLRADRRHRRVLVPVFVYGIAAVLFTPFSSAVLGGLLHVPAMVRGILQLAVYTGIPIAFALGVLRGGFAKTGELEELGTWLGGSGAARPALAAALAATLGDPSLELSYWVPQRAAFVDSEGRPVVPSEAGSGRGHVEIHVRGARVGAISYDSGLVADPELVRTAGRVVAIAVDRERLTAELLANRAALQRSRKRLVDAIDRERRRIAQDLHDGLQVQLVLLALEAQQLANTPEAGEALAHRATRLREALDTAASDLRQLVHAVMPAALIERGLSAAVEDLTDRMPVPTTLTMSPDLGRLAPTVESTAYFVVAEALANTVKHAGADSASVLIERQAANLRIEVSDDGSGGAHANGGAGLRGIADRIDVLGGQLTVVSGSGGGTRIAVELPCG